MRKKRENENRKRNKRKRQTDRQRDVSTMYPKNVSILDFSKRQYTKLILNKGVEYVSSVPPHSQKISLGEWVWFLLVSH